MGFLRWCPLWLSMLCLMGVVGCEQRVSYAQPAAGAANSPSDRPENKSRSADMVRVRVVGPDGKLTDPIEQPKVELSEADWKKRLTPEQFRILRSKGTERPFCGGLLQNKEHGYYLCAGCNLPLFESNAKFDSGTGWPSFFQPVARENILEEVDRSHGMVRTEIMCMRCEGHLGHVFDDGPRPTGLRYCLNSESLKFVADDQLKTVAEKIPASTPVQPATTQPGASNSAATQPAQQQRAEAVFAGGCFWCVEAVFEHIDGVYEVISGYSGGDAAMANYEAVCTGRTKHAEVVKIVYNPAKVSYEQLLKVHFATHDPTTLNRQGNDVGPQYRSAIFFASEQEKQIAQAFIDDLTDAKAFKSKIVTTLEPLTGFYPAEAYHQDYAFCNPGQPYIRAIALPKVEKVRSKFKDMVKPEGELPQRK